MNSGQPDFWVKYWGVRGSIPAPGPDTVRYGGNTTSLQIQCGDQALAIDGGTGVRLYGDWLRRQMPVDVTFLMTHLHLDHVQGFPFFLPLLIPGNRFTFYSARHNGSGIEDVLRQLFAQPAFPVSIDMLKSDYSFRHVEPGQLLQFGDVRVRTALLHHPGGVLGYRIELGGRTFVHCSDWEHPADGSLDPVLLDLARDCDVLSIDATYTEAEYHGHAGDAPRRGWGHASHEAALRHAKAAGARRTVLFHHDPNRGDDQLDDIAAFLAAEHPDASLVREGDVVRL